MSLAVRALSGVILLLFIAAVPVIAQDDAAEAKFKAMSESDTMIMVPMKRIMVMTTMIMAMTTTITMITATPMTPITSGPMFGVSFRCVMPRTTA